MEKLPMKYENGFFGKLKRFFKDLFCQKHTFEYNKVDQIKEKSSIDVSNTNVFDEMQNEFKKFQNEKFIVEQTVKNPEIIKNLSEEKLKKLDELYNQKIEDNNRIIRENDKKIAKLKSKLNNN